MASCHFDRQASWFWRDKKLVLCTKQKKKAIKEEGHHIQHGRPWNFRTFPIEKRVFLVSFFTSNFGRTTTWCSRIIKEKEKKIHPIIHTTSSNFSNWPFFFDVLFIIFFFFFLFVQVIKEKQLFTLLSHLGLRQFDFVLSEIKDNEPLVCFKALRLYAQLLQAQDSLNKIQFSGESEGRHSLFLTRNNQI